MQIISSQRPLQTIARFLGLVLCLLLGGTALQAQSQRDLFRRVMPSVVLVHAERNVTSLTGRSNEKNESMQGGGALVAADGKVVTAASVVRDAFRIEVEFFDGSRAAARVLTTAAQADVVLLQVDKVPAKAVAATFGDSSSTAVGDQVFLIGSAAGVKQGLSVSWVSARLATEKTAVAPTALELLQLDLAPVPGTAGSPLFNLKGQVVGVVSQALAKSQVNAKASVAVTSNLTRALLLGEKPGGASASAPSK